MADSVEKKLPVGGGCQGQGDLWDRLSAESDFPLSAMLAITERCNLSCEHCYLPSEPASDELSFEEMIDVMDQLAEAGTLKLTLTGGEPALRPDLTQLVGAAVRKHFAVQLKTNGVMLDVETVERLWNVGLSELHVSLYSDLAADHDRFVGVAGAWQRTTEVLDQFKELGGIPRVSIVGMSWNAPRVTFTIDLCEERGWKYNADLRISAGEDGRLAPLKLMASEQEMIGVFAEPRLESAPNGLKSPDSSVCLAGRSAPYIRPNGDIWPCPSLPILFGNLREKSYREVWLESPERKRLLQLKWGDSEKCMGCSHMATCERCPGDAYWEHGDLRRPSSTDCMMARAREEAWKDRK